MSDEVPQDQVPDTETQQLDVDEAADRQIGAIIQNLSSDEIDMLRDAFIYMDRDSDGFVSMEEMMVAVHNCVGDDRFGPLRDYLVPIFHVADKDRDNKLSLTEFLSSFADGPGVVPQDVILQSVSSIRVRLSDEEIAALQESFRRIDKNQDGFIDRDELRVALKEILLSKFPDLTEHTFSEIVTIVMASADADRDGRLSLSEFIRSFQEDQGVLPAAFIDVRAQQVARQLTQEEIAVLKEAFAALDRNNDGFIDFVEMYQALWEALESSIQDKSQVKELCDLIMVMADRNQEGKLTLTDFIRNFVQNMDLMKIPVAAAQERIRKTNEKLQQMLDSGEVERLVRIFRDLDINKDGYLDKSEVTGVLDEQIRAAFPDIKDELVAEVITAIVDAADVDHDGRLSLVEFVRSFVEGSGVLPDNVVEQYPIEDGNAVEGTEEQPTQELTPEELRVVLDTFEAMDVNQDGYVQFEELKGAIAKALGEEVPEEQLQHITVFVFANVDHNDDGKISWTEFRKSFEMRQGLLPTVVPQDVAQPQPEEQSSLPSGQSHENPSPIAPRPPSPVAQQLAAESSEPGASTSETPVMESPVYDQSAQGPNDMPIAAPEPEQILEATPDDAPAVETPIKQPSQPQQPIEIRSPIAHDVSGVCISDAQLRQEFSKYDRNGNGFLDRNEFKKVFLSLEHFGLVPSQSDIDRQFSRYGNGERVTYDEFCILMLERSRM